MGNGPLFDMGNLTPADFLRVQREIGERGYGELPEDSREVTDGISRGAMDFVGFVGTILMKLGLFNPSVASEIARGVSVEAEEGQLPDQIMRQAWNKQAHRWAVIESPMNYYMTMRTILEHLRSNEKQRREIVLSLGSGPGLYETYLGHVMKLTGVRRTRFYCLDAAAEMTRRHKAILEQVRVTDGRSFNLLDNVEPLCGDMMRLPFRDDSVDQIICNNSLQWASDWRKVIAEMSRVIRRKGLGHLYLVVHLHPMSVADDKGQVILKFGDFAPQELFDELENYRFELRFVRQIAAPNGAGQLGNAINRLFVHAKFQADGSFPRWREKQVRSRFKQGLG